MLQVTARHCGYQNHVPKVVNILSKQQGRMLVQQQCRRTLITTGSSKTWLNLGQEKEKASRSNLFSSSRIQLQIRTKKKVAQKEAEEVDVKGLLQTIGKEMDEYISKFNTSTEQLLARLGRVSPIILDPIRVDFEGKKIPISAFATVSAKEGNLMVNLYDASNAKIVQNAIINANLSLNPTPITETTLKVPIPPLLDSHRNELTKKAGEIAEKTRKSIRNVGTIEKKKYKDDKSISKDIEKLTSTKTQIIDQKQKEIKSKITASV